MKIHNRSWDHLKTGNERSILAIARPVSCMLLMISFLFAGILPDVHTQPLVSLDETLDRSGQPIMIGKNIDTTASKMSAGSFSLMKSLAAKNKTGAAKARSRSGVETEYFVLNVEFNSPVSRRAIFSDRKTSLLENASVLTTIDRFADVFVSSETAWEALLRNPNVVRVEFASKVTAPPPPPIKPADLISQAIPETIVRGGYKGLTGRNVIIAVLDTGIDFRHPDFITYDAQGLPTSRLLYFWDTAAELQPGRGTPAPMKFPNGTSIGTLYTKAQLTAELRSGRLAIPPTDLDGHGTACAGVAAGNGNADKRTGGLKRSEVVGVAPDADIIGVRMGALGFENGFMLNAIAEWLDRAAGVKPLVISGSFGGHYSSHDGQSVEERHLNTRFPLDRPGRSVVFAAGNEGSDAIHAKVAFGKEAKRVSWNANVQARVRVFFDSADRGIQIIPTRATPLVLGKNYWIELNRLTGQMAATIDVPAGIGGLWFENSSGTTSEAHLYFADTEYGSFLENVDFGYLVGTPGSTINAITVGSYDWNDNFHEGGRIVSLTSVCPGRDGRPMPFEIGWLSCYSSPGPNRNGVVKPEVVSPGEWFAAANARVDGVSAGEWAREDSTGNYRRMNGTSAATPYTAGIVALMFQKKPTLTLGMVRDLLKGKASKSGLNPSRQAVPNNNWGYGKLDMAAVDRIFAAIQ